MVEKKEKKKQVFYDPTHHRWTYFKWLAFLGLLFLLAAFGAAAFNAVRLLPFSSLGLKNPTPNYRGSVRANNPDASFAIVSSQKISNQQAANQTGASTPKVIAFYVDWDDTSLTSLKDNAGNIDELVPEWMHLADGDGNISADNEERQKETTDYLNQNYPNMKIVPLINNFNPQIQDWDSAQLNQMLSSPAARTKAIKNIYNFITAHNFSGVSVDFENIYPRDQQNLLLFMRELYGVFHPIGLEVSQNIPLDDDSYNAKALSSCSDFIILMAYDENSPGSDPAGPIASQTWFVNNLKWRLTQVPAGKYVVSLGNYGYDWQGSSINGTEDTFQDAVQTAKESEGNIQLDSATLNPAFDYYDDNNNLHHVWFLDATTVYNEIAAAKNYGFYGYGLWRLGSEDPSVWKIFKNPDLGSGAANSLEAINYGYDIDYEGDGEILRVAGTPQKGKREINFDPGSGLILGEKIIVYPSAYVIDEWGVNNNKKIALTFDDGPSSGYTSQILDVLDRYNVKATFFVIGLNAANNQGAIKRMADSGDEIGNHTFTHPDISAESDKTLTYEVNVVESLLGSIIGRQTILFRPPYSEDVEPGTPDQVKPLLTTDKLGYYTVGMNIDPRDWSRPGVDAIVNGVISETTAGDGNIILLHDGGGDRSQTVAALPGIIEGLQSRGYQFVTVSDLIGVSHDAVMPPVPKNLQWAYEISGIAFSFSNWSTSFLRWIFFAGIVLGIARFIFIGILAAIESLKRRKKNYPADYYPLVSVVIPAYNEENVIVRTILSILSSPYPNFNLIVVDDGSTDSTYEILTKAFSHDQKVKIFTKPNGGKSSALNFGIEQSRAEIIVTLDADTVFHRDTIEKLVRPFADERIGAVAGNAKVGNRINILTRWQALEYITSQNLDRRAFDLMNCITVVPGSVGAWRREAVLRSGGFSGRTLAEDADLTFFIVKLGYKVIYEDRAVAFTEAPDSVRNFIKQRFRWMYGTLQSVWEHLDMLFHSRYKGMGFVAIPNIFIFQIFFPLVSPLMDLAVILSLLWAAWQKHFHPLDYSAVYSSKYLIVFYLLFLAVDFFTAAAAFLLEHKEDWKLLFWVVPQRFFYRQLMYCVAIKVFLTVLKGSIVGWRKFERKATVRLEEMYF